MIYEKVLHNELKYFWLDIYLWYTSFYTGRKETLVITFLLIVKNLILIRLAEVLLRMSFESTLVYTLIKNLKLCTTNMKKIPSTILNEVRTVLKTIFGHCLFVRALTVSI